MIEVIGLTKSYGRKSILTDINLTFEPGLVYGIVGSNGAGKTTLFKCIAGLEKHKGIVHSTYGKTKDHIGYLETNPTVMSRLTGLEYLKLLSLARKQRYADFKAQNIFNLPLQEYAQHYSTGMKKKLALTAILLQRNNIYILDEPFSGVDIQSNILISEIIRRLKSENKIVIIASHIFSILSEVCDQIFVLNEGKIEQIVHRDDFDSLDERMKERFIDNKLDGLKF
jgi:ABC-2 type transport system ATP-binding protein